MENCFGITWIHLVVTQKSQDLGKFTIGDFNNLGLIDILKCYMHIVYCEILTGYFFSKKMLPLLRRGFKGAANPNVT